jgi:hypothetical protein
VVEVKDRLLAIGGKGSLLDTKHRVYIEFVANGIPFLRQRARFHQLADMNASLKHFELAALDVVDVVVSKLKRFHPRDQSDIREMIYAGHAHHRDVVRCFREAIDCNDGQADAFPRYVENLHTIERDLFAVSETEIELPPWVSDRR